MMIYFLGKIMGEGNDFKISINKIFAFVVFNFLLGLLQAWLLIAINYPTKGLDFESIFSDGGIYFFSTSLCYSSLFSLLQAPNRKKNIGTSIFSITITCLIVVTGCSVFSYPEVMRQVPLPADAFAKYRMSQVACLLTSSFYAFYVATLTGMFEGKND